MTYSFEKQYSEFYDLLYQDKDYKKECDFIEKVFKLYSSKPISTILDGGCGTGNHAILFSKRGYKITGIDSSLYMVKIARKKSKDVNFEVGDLRKINLKKKFDAALCMFAVISYITETDKVLRTFKNIRRHLEKGGLFIFDVWNGLAVLRTLPSERVKILEDAKKNRRIFRIAKPELNPFYHLCNVSYHLLEIKENTLLNEIKEVHVMRYFFPQEIIYYLKVAGFEILKVSPCFEINETVSENTWNIVIIAKAK